MYNNYQITSTTDKDILIAFLSNYGFDSFQEEDDGTLSAFQLATEHETSLKQLAELNEQFPLEFTCESLPEKNWNEIWESNFEPIRVGDKLGVRASFHEPMEGVKQELVLDPKMAFGTGHHATTYMVSDAMFDVDLSAKSVLDYGCGTGVLAILGKRLGAGFTWAVDIELPSYENTLENAEINQVKLDVVTHGTLDDVDEKRTFDIILANINRNVILASLPSLYERLNPGGLLFVSGILQHDGELVENTALEAGFTVNRRQKRQDWLAWIFNR
jgi:ribosomal protein L11 methyltransferase